MTMRALKRGLERTIFGGGYCWVAGLVGWGVSYDCGVSHVAEIGVLKLDIFTNTIHKIVLRCNL